MDGSVVVFRKLPVAESKANLRRVVNQAQERSRRVSAPPVAISISKRSVSLIRSKSIAGTIPENAASHVQQKRYSESQCNSSQNFETHFAQVESIANQSNYITTVKTSKMVKLFIKILLLIIIATFLLYLFCDYTRTSFTESQLFLTFEGDYKLDELSADLDDNVFGQSLAVDLMMGELQTFLKNDSETSLLLLYLLGSSGTGKTFVSRILTNHFQSLGINVMWFVFSSSDPITTQQNVILSKVTLWTTNIFILDDFEIEGNSLTSKIELFKNAIEHLKWDSKFDGTKFVLVISSNSMAEEINGVVLSAHIRHTLRQQLTVRDFSFLNSTLSAGHRAGSDKKIDHDSLEKKEKHVFIPFLPLTREYVGLCIQKMINSFDNQSLYEDEYADFVANSITYVPADYPIFSKHGCKKILFL